MRSRKRVFPSADRPKVFRFRLIIFLPSQISPEPKNNPRSLASFKLRKITRGSFSESTPSPKTMCPLRTANSEGISFWAGSMGEGSIMSSIFT